MRTLVYVHQYFRTPEEGGAIRSYYLARSWVEAGGKVTVITSHNHKKMLVKDIEGIEVVYLPVFYDNYLAKWGRVKAFLRFLVLAYRHLRKFKRSDSYFYSSTPLTVGGIALGMYFFHRRSFIFEVRDLWPEAPIQMGYIRSPCLKTLLYSFEKLIYRKAKKIVTLSPGMQAQVQKKAGQEKEVLLIPNMADCEFFRPQTNSGIPFRIIYPGALGKANHLDYLLDIAACLQAGNVTNVNILIVGEGAERPRLEKRIKTESLNLVSLLPPRGKAELKELLEQSAAVYTSFLSRPVLETSSPNKFFDGLAAGKLCIVNTKGWLKELVEWHQCGFYADPLDPSSFIQSLNPFLQNPALLKEYQANARALALNQFSRKSLEKQFLNLVNN